MPPCEGCGCEPCTCAAQNASEPHRGEYEYLCDAPLARFGVGCLKKGRAEYGGRCHIHRPKTPAENAQKRAENLRVWQYGEAKADAETAKSRYTRFGNELLADLIEAHESEPSELPSDLRTRIAKLCELSAAWGAAVRKMDGFSE